MAALEFTELHSPVCVPLHRHWLLIQFRRQGHSPGKTIIHNYEVEIVSKYKYLGTISDDKLKWDDNTEEIVKKGQQRLNLLRKLNYFSVDQKILTLLKKILYWECSVILFHLLVSQRGSEEQEQPAKNCPYRLQNNCSAPERPGSFLWTADLTESPLYFNEGSYFKLGIYCSPIRSSS